MTDHQRGEYETLEQYGERMRDRLIKAETLSEGQRQFHQQQMRSMYDRATAAEHTSELWKNSSDSHKQELDNTRNELAHCELERDIARKHGEECLKAIEVLQEDRRKLAAEVEAHLGTINRLRTPQIDDKGQLTWPDSAYRELQMAFHRVRNTQQNAKEVADQLRARNQRVVMALERMYLSLVSSNPRDHLAAIEEIQAVLLEEEFLKNHLFEYHYCMQDGTGIVEFCKICNEERSKHVSAEDLAKYKSRGRTEKGITDMAENFLHRIMKKDK